MVKKTVRKCNFCLFFKRDNVGYYTEYALFYADILYAFFLIYICIVLPTLINLKHQKSVFQKPNSWDKYNKDY